VIAGTAKAIRLAAVPDGTRPLSDRAREGLFSSIGRDVIGARFADLFAGTGAVGIEALSRGADAATFVERSPAAIRVIRENLSRAGVADRATVRRSPVERAIRPGFGPFDVVVLDPPYAIAPAALDAVFAALAEHGAGTRGGLVVLTREHGGYMPVIPVNWAADRRLSYGDAVIFAFRIGPEQPPTTEQRED
jgi:16S rRNA (guanine966-N2)-methyltransferase